MVQEVRLTLEQEDLLKMHIRMSGMQAAIALHCCHRARNNGQNGGFSIADLEELLPILMEIRDRLLASALDPGAGPI